MGISEDLDRIFGRDLARKVRQLAEAAPSLTEDQRVFIDRVLQPRAASEAAWTEDDEQADAAPGFTIRPSGQPFPPGYIDQGQSTPVHFTGDDEDDRDLR
jgi:hypothetical protein